MAALEMNVRQERRRAIYTPLVDRPKFGMERGKPVECHVLGLYQVTDEDDVNPYFVIELSDGKCTYASPEQIMFVKEADKC